MYTKTHTHTHIVMMNRLKEGGKPDRRASEFDAGLTDDSDDCWKKEGFS